MPGRSTSSIERGDLKDDWSHDLARENPDSGLDPNDDLENFEGCRW